MAEDHALPVPRSPHLMDPSDTLLLVIDVQEKLWPHISGRERLFARLDLLLRAAEVLSVPVLATEQYVKGLGSTIAPLLPLLPKRVEKIAFSAGFEPAVLSLLDRPGLRKILLVGIETHVCVLQTALDLLANGFQVYVAVDAVGSRSPIDRDVALRRMESAGVRLTTAESAVFEWTRVAGTPNFKRISELVKQHPPALAEG